MRNFFGILDQLNQSASLQKYPTIGESLSRQVKNRSEEIVRKYIERVYNRPPAQLFPESVDKELIGIEIEVENIDEDLECESNLGQYFWHIKADGSLRDCGKEFVSVPLEVGAIPYALQHLNHVFTAYEVEPNFTNRCSIHIHVNVLDMTITELLVFILLYFIYEKHFFTVAGTKRESNIFCVPLNESDSINYILGNLKYISKNDYASYLETLCSNWRKYNALNLACIYGNSVVHGYGTVEFRHLYDTLDNKILSNWIKSICYLKQFSKQYSLKHLLEFLKSSCTTSEYVELYRKIFKDTALPINLKEVEKSITTLKLVLEQYPRLPVNQLCATDSVLHMFLREKG